jgi:hypothetical protein
MATSAMESIIDGFFSSYEFGPIGDAAGLAYEHFDNAEGVCVFRVARASDAVEPLVAEAVEKLARSYPECAAVEYRIIGG